MQGATYGNIRYVPATVCCTCLPVTPVMPACIPQLAWPNPGTSSQSGGALSFDGVCGYVQIDDVPSISSFTMMAWIQPASSAWDAGETTIFQRGPISLHVTDGNIVLSMQESDPFAVEVEICHYRLALN